MVEVPWIISADDHVLEPPDLWTSRLPEKYHDRCPRVIRDKAVSSLRGGKLQITRGAAEGNWADFWLFEAKEMALFTPMASAGMADVDATTTTYDDVRPGCWRQADRLEDMDLNHIDVSVCFPNVVPRFCGQTFVEATDKELGLLCVRAYNDWMIDEWSSGAARGRLIPLTIMPMWDVEASVAEVLRCADKGSHAVTFSENPHQLGLPSVHRGDRYWDPLFRACEETETVMAVHIGSSSTTPTTAPDAPHAVSSAIFFQNTVGALCDHLVSGTFERFPGLKMLLAEGQVGWMPYVLERLDHLWEHRDREATIGIDLSRPPSSYVAGHIYGCIYEDAAGLAMRDLIGMDQITFEADYPHNDGTFPHTAEIAGRICDKAGLSSSEAQKFLRTNAIELFGLGRYGITA